MRPHPALHRRRGAALGLAACALLAACGGGASDKGDTRKLQAVSSDPAASEAGDAASTPPIATLAPTGAGSAAAASAASGASTTSATSATSTASVAAPAQRLRIASAQGGTSGTSGAVTPADGSAAALPAAVTDASAGSTDIGMAGSGATAGSAALPPTSLTTSRLLTGVDLSRTLSSYNWIWSLECAGKVMGATAVPDAGLLGTTAGGSQETLRFGKVVDPLAPTRKVLMFKAHRDDARIAGAPRCEITFSPTQAGRLPVGRDFWFAFGLLLPGWTPSADEQIVAQWHQANGTVPLNPFFAISVQGQALRFQARQDGSESVSKATVIQPIDFQSPGLPIKAWSYFVVHARISPDPADKPYLQLWRDGVQLFNYQGPLGYNISASAPFAKIGHYHWIDASNPWPAATPSRTVLFRAPSFVLDETGAYGPDDLRGYVMKN